MFVHVHALSSQNPYIYRLLTYVVYFHKDYASFSKLLQTKKGKQVSASANKIICVYSEALNETGGKIMSQVK